MKPTPTRKPDIVVYADGQILLNARARQTLVLLKGDVVNIHRVGYDEYVIYVHKRAFEAVGDQRNVLHPSKPPYKHLRFFNAGYAKMLLPKKAIKAGFYIGPRTSYASRVAANIITHNPLDVQYRR